MKEAHCNISTNMNSTHEMLAQAEGTGGTSLKSPTFGYIAIVVCAIGFGTNYLPVKKFKMGDGKMPFLSFEYDMQTRLLSKLPCSTVSTILHSNHISVSIYIKFDLLV